MILALTRELPSGLRKAALTFCGSAVRKDGQMIGWLPWAFYESVDASGHLLTLERNGDLVGFVAWRPPTTWGASVIVQTWVREDARMIEHGRALVARVAEIAAAEGARWLTCWVANDLDAMRFWPAIGFTRVASRLGRGPLLEMHGRRMLTQFASRTQQEMPPWQQPPTPAPQRS
jgi:ribosomal protein S18 acetylase RimI-like enzyme